MRRRRTWRVPQRNESIQVCHALACTGSTPCPASLPEPYRRPKTGASIRAWRRGNQDVVESLGTVSEKTRIGQRQHTTLRLREENSERRSPQQRAHHLQTNQVLPGVGCHGLKVLSATRDNIEVFRACSAGRLFVSSTFRHVLYAIFYGVPNFHALHHALYPR